MANFSNPVGPRGIYDFGFPSALIDIHFPHKAPTNESFPWFWYITPQTPRYFQYLGSQVGGHGWQAEEFLPIIKILPIDTQKLVPTTEVGFSSVEEVALRTFKGEPISSSAWGRFRFNVRDQFFWKVIGERKPEFTAIRGVLTQQGVHRGKDIKPAIEDAVKLWRDDWNSLGALFNAATLGVDGLGDYTVINQSPFSVPLPYLFTLPQLQSEQGKYYFGPIQPSWIFQTGQAAFWKGAFSFKMEVGQLDPTIWDMSVFPPQLTTDPLSERIPSNVSHNYGGYSLLSPDFPTQGLNIN